MCLHTIRINKTTRLKLKLRLGTRQHNDENSFENSIRRDETNIRVFTIPKYNKTITLYLDLRFSTAKLEDKYTFLRYRVEITYQEFFIS